jgi:hypothetical protein
MNYSLLIALFLGAGILGGLCSYYLLGNSEHDRTSIDQMPALVIGVVASFASPLALHFLGNTWIKEADANPQNYFLIFAFALVAASYSKRFLESVNRRVLAEVKQTKREVEEIKEQITEPTPPSPAISESVALSLGSVSDPQKQIIDAIYHSKFTYRTLHGLAKQLGIAAPALRQELARLITMGLVVERTTKDGALTYGITHKAYSDDPKG